MNGMAILFMLVFWMFITALTTFCLTLIFFSQDKKRDVTESEVETTKG